MGRKLFVGNLSFDVTNSDLEALFQETGGCESVAVITDRFSGQSRGFGDGVGSDAQRAIKQLDGKAQGQRSK
jgi:RNA recognition motif-containing protein